MVKFWFNNACVEVTVDTIQDFMRRHNYVPPTMVSAYQDVLRTATKGQKILFFQLLHEKCPEAMEYFKDV